MRGVPAPRRMLVCSKVGTLPCEDLMVHRCTNMFYLSESPQKAEKDGDKCSGSSPFR